MPAAEQNPPVSHPVWVRQRHLSSCPSCWSSLRSEQVGGWFSCLFSTNRRRLLRGVYNDSFFGEPEGFSRESLIAYWAAEMPRVSTNLLIFWINRVSRSLMLHVSKAFIVAHRPPPSVWRSPRSLCCPRGWPERGAAWPWRRASVPSACNETTSGSTPQLQTLADWTHTGTEPAKNMKSKLNA